jgi:hypothetical protein
MGNIDPSVISFFNSHLHSWQTELRRSGGSDRRIVHAIEKLNHARATGKWTNDDFLDIAIHSKPGYITSTHGRINRGETFEILEIDDGWMHIRRERGLEGWISVRQTIPNFPVRINSQPGTAGPGDLGGQRKEIEIGGRG